MGIIIRPVQTGLLRSAPVSFSFLVSPVPQHPKHQHIMVLPVTTNSPRVMKFGLSLDSRQVWVDLEYQGHGSKVRVSGPKKRVF